MSGMVKVNKEIGAEVILAARKQRLARFNSTIVARVESLMNEKDSLEILLAHQQRLLEQKIGQLAAIENGEFTVGQQGKISFQSQFLNEDLVAVSRCRSCGSDQHADCGFVP